jgi:ElaA protein
MSPRIAQEIRPARTTRERDAALDLRRRVFCDEQGVAPELEPDERDSDALHLVAVSERGVVGTCRLVFDGPTAKLGRMAVERAARGHGVGADILEAALAAARDAGARRVALNAQTGAVGFYARAGFVARGDRFDEAGIEHVRMDLDLARA